LPSLCQRLQNISRNKIPLRQFVPPIRYKECSKLTSTKPESFPFVEKQTNVIVITNSASSITATDCVRDLGVLIDTALHFRQQVDNIFSQAIRLLWLIRSVTFPFSSLHSLLTLYCTLGILKLQYASVAWNFITSSDARKMERIQRQFVSLCHHCFLSHQDYSYGNVLYCCKLHTLIAWRCYLHVLF
jgi:hypothetical protein